MRALDVFMTPGNALLGLVFNVFQLSPGPEHALMLAIAAGLLSWIVWIVVVKTVWFITLRLLGLA